MTTSTAEIKTDTKKRPTKDWEKDVLEKVSHLLGYDVKETYIITSNEVFSKQIIEAAKEVETGKTKTHKEIFGKEV